MKLAVLFLPLFLLLSACAGSTNSSETSLEKLSSPNRVAPKNDDEKQILVQVATAVPGRPVKLKTSIFVVTSVYFAASGRECKTIDVSQPNTNDSIRKTACSFSGSWGYIPDVFPSPIQ